jgi:hypothetical protein
VFKISYSGFLKYNTKPPIMQSDPRSVLYILYNGTGIYSAPRKPPDVDEIQLSVAGNGMIEQKKPWSASSIPEKILYLLRAIKGTLAPNIPATAEASLKFLSQGKGDYATLNIGQQKTTGSDNDLRTSIELRTKGGKLVWVSLNPQELCCYDKPGDAPIALFTPPFNAESSAIAIQ